ncbi:MAG: RNA polymerase sigma factor [Candidatus Acidiferrales bacterium]
MNRTIATGVWQNGAALQARAGRVALQARAGRGMMDALAPNLSGIAVTADESYLPARGAATRIDEAALAQQFEQRLADCPTLAYRVALGVLRNTAEAEDVAQEAMLRAYRNFHRLRDRERFRAWLVRTAWRLALDRIRSAGRQERRERVVIEQSCSETGVEGVIATREFERKLAAALDELPEKLRMVIVLAAIEGYDTREVAKLVGVPEGTVKSRLHHARKRLAVSLYSAGISPTIFPRQGTT